MRVRNGFVLLYNVIRQSHYMEELITMFIVIDGPNGSGKTTLINKLKASGHKTLSSPNGTPLAQMLRPACRGTEPWTDINERIQFLLFSAARLDEYIRLVLPEDRSTKIFADRWWTSTYVYQCILQGISVRFMEETIYPEEQIDLVILLDADNQVLIDRVQAERAANPSHGVCAWTQEQDTICQLAEIYRNGLRDYLSSRNIDHTRLNTNNLTQDEIFDQVLILTENRRIKFCYSIGVES